MKTKDKDQEWLRKQRSKFEFNIGDRVLVYDKDDNLAYDGTIAIVVEKLMIGGEWNYGLFIDGQTKNVYPANASLPKLRNIFRTTNKIGTSGVLAPFYAEDLELVESKTWKKRVVNIDVQAMMRLQRKYDKLKADCKDFFNVILNLAEGRGEMRVAQFNYPDAFLSAALDKIREHATWKPKNEEDERHEI